MEIDVEYMLELHPEMKMFLMEQCFHLPFSRLDYDFSFEYMERCERYFDRIITGMAEDGTFVHREHYKSYKPADALYWCMRIIYDFCQSGVFEATRGSLTRNPLSWG